MCVSWLRRALTLSHMKEPLGYVSLLHEVTCFENATVRTHSNPETRPNPCTSNHMAGVALLFVDSEGADALAHRGSSNTERVSPAALTARRHQSRNFAVFRNAPHTMGPFRVSVFAFALDAS